MFDISVANLQTSTSVTSPNPHDTTHDTTHTLPSFRENSEQSWDFGHESLSNLKQHLGTQDKRGGAVEWGDTQMLPLAHE